MALEADEAMNAAATHTFPRNSSSGGYNELAPNIEPVLPSLTAAVLDVLSSERLGPQLMDGASFQREGNLGLGLLGCDEGS